MTTAAPARPQTVRRKAMSAPVTAADWCVGLVVDAKPERWTVSSGELRASARRAAGCLLEPAVGDSVACLRVAPDELWILSVLQREDGAPQVLRCQGDTQLVVEKGALRIDASSIELHGDQLRASVQRTEWSTGTAEVVGCQLRVTATTLKLVGSVLSSVMDRVQHFSRHYLRTTDGMDRVAATHVELEASQLVRVTGEHVLTTGEKLVKARGGQIHFG